VANGQGLVTYHDGVILETLLESLEDGLFMLLLDDAGSCGEDAKSVFSLLSLGCLTELEQGTQKFRPGIICR